MYEIRLNVENQSSSYNNNAVSILKKYIFFVGKMRLVLCIITQCYAFDVKQILFEIGD